jgi:hypothetical protein
MLLWNSVAVCNADRHTYFNDLNKYNPTNLNELSETVKTLTL